MDISRRPFLKGAATLAVSAMTTRMASAVPRQKTGPSGGHKFDLSGLPIYRPERQVEGTLRFVGTPMRGAVEAWEAGFAKYHPGIRFANSLLSSDMAMPGLIMGVADIAPCGREACLEEVLGFSEKYLHDPTSIAIASGAADTPGGASWSPVIFVSKDNPLTALTVEQLDGIFGEQRTGGYPLNSVVWDPKNARGADRNIRTWGQLGLTGDWANRPIETFGYAPTGMRSFFELRVFNGGKKWNPNYREYVDSGTKMVAEGSSLASLDMLAAIATNRFAIGWSANGHAAKVPGLKAIALGRVAGEYFAPDAANMQARRYPLTRSVFMHINAKPGQPVDPKIREFLRYVLSREAQEEMQKGGNQLPLTAEIVEIERRKLG